MPTRKPRRRATATVAASLAVLALAMLLALPQPAAADEGKAHAPLGLDLERLKDSARDLAQDGLDSLDRNSEHLERAAKRAEGLLRDLGNAGAASWQQVRERLKAAWKHVQKEIERAQPQERPSAPREGVTI